MAIRTTGVILAVVLSAAVGGGAAAQNQNSKLQRCAPWGRDLMLGFCSQEEKDASKAWLAAKLNAPSPSAADPQPAPAAVAQIDSVPAGAGKARGRADIVVRVSPDDLDALDAWIAAQPDKPSRAEAISRLMKRGMGG